MILIRSKFVFILVLGLIISSCVQDPQDEKKAPDPLPSWNESKSKSSIIEFVTNVTNTESSNFIKIEDRIATFDNDGNLWSEQPAYFQLFFALDRMNELLPEHPEWKTEQPFKAAIERDLKELAKYGEHGLLQIVMATHAGITTEEFEYVVKNWLATAKHPRFNRPFTDLVYHWRTTSC